MVNEPFHKTKLRFAHSARIHVVAFEIMDVCMIYYMSKSKDRVICTGETKKKRNCVQTHQRKSNKGYKLEETTRCKTTEKANQNHRSHYDGGASDVGTCVTPVTGLSTGRCIGSSTSTTGVLGVPLNSSLIA
jgi:hypothetical protein